MDHPGRRRRVGAGLGSLMKAVVGGVVMPRLALLRGAAAGAAGTTALNTATYVDMIVRARPASRTPQESVEKLSEESGIDVPGQVDERDNRIEGMAPLLGIATGIGVGLLLGAARAVGWRPRLLTEAVAATGIALVGANAPMTALGISDPRSWSKADWVADLVPHLAYGLVTAAALRAMCDESHGFRTR